MKAVVDTNVIAYALLGTPKYADEAFAFLAAGGELLAPALWEAELANVVWMSVRAGVITPEAAPAKLGLASRLGVHSVEIRSLWHGALARSLNSGIAVYDTLFVELAERERLRVVTFDRKLLAAFPTLACKPRHLVA